MAQRQPRINTSVLESLRNTGSSNTAHAAAKAPPAPEEPVVFAAKAACAKNEQMFSELFPGITPSPDFPVRRFEPTEWDEEVREFIPAVNPLYIFPGPATEDYVRALMHGDNTFVYGGTGTGKSTLAEQVCARLGIPFYRINFYRQVEYSAVFGTVTIANGTMSYAHGPIGIMARHGGVLCLDEMTAASPDITMSLQRVLEDNKQVYLPDYPGDPSERMIHPHDWFRIVATDNTNGQGDATGRYAGTNVQNSATMDRFQTVIELGYPPASAEREIIKAVALASKVQIPAAEIDRMITFAGQVRSAYLEGTLSMTMSTRTLVNWVRHLARHGQWERALTTTWYNKLGELDRKLANELYHRVFARFIG